MITGRPPKSAESRFWTKVNIAGEDDCWEWKAGPDNSYGHFWMNELHRSIAASRAVWMITVGPIPDGMLICHHCDNPRCVNPKHLFLGTNQDNMLDMMNKGRNRNPRGRQHGQHGTNCWENKLSEAQVREIRSRYAKGGIPMHKLAKEYGVGYSTINYLINRRNWSWLE